MDKFTYRPDIDGLRAVAVLLVLFFHAKLGFPGGYVGVDVFFVISGYLITGIIVKAQEENKFSLANFWTRRLRRILPAAAVVVAFTLLAGCFLLTPKDLYEFGVSAIWQQAMLSNVYFWKHTGYFAGSADLMPLLHTWSLAVEEQFYLGYPFLLILGRKWKKKNLGLMLSLLMIFSFSISVWGVENYPVPAFFLLPSRMWELLIGGLLVLLPAKQAGKALWRESMAWTGVAAIVLPGLYYNAYMPFPGIAALPPCLGADRFLRPMFLPVLESVRSQGADEP